MTINKKKETEKLGQQIKMLEKMNARLHNKQLEKSEDNINLKSMIEMKKLKKEEENFQKATMLHLMEKMRDEVYKIKMEITEYEREIKKIQNDYDKERIQENVIMDKINNFGSKITNFKTKNSKEDLNNGLLIRYYNNVIDQKWSFINSADERKEKQLKIAYEAKNDNQDKEEVEKRKVLSLCFMYNKYLRKKMEKELKDNASLEQTFQTIKDITGSSNLKTIVDKIMSKDKNYNMYIAKVTEKENKMEIVKKDIKSLEDQYQKLKNDFPDETVQDNLFLTGQGQKLHLENDEEALLEEENSLLAELKVIQEKHKDVRLIYEKVTENIKNICKIENKKQDDTTNNSININNSAEINNINYDTENSLMNNYYRNIGTGDDELVRSFKEYLDYTRKNVEMTFSNVGREEFIRMMKERGDKQETINASLPKNKREKAKIAPNKKNATDKHSNIKESNTTNQATNNNLYVNGYNEYEYFDEDNVEDDKKIKEEYDAIINNYRKKEKQRLLELARPDKDKKN